MARRKKKKLSRKQLDRRNVVRRIENMTEEERLERNARRRAAQTEERRLERNKKV